MIVVFFAVSLLASIVGSICGIGGGVIIKPVLDAMNVMSVSCISFLSGCTVLTMSVVSVYKNMRAGKKLNLRIATLLAVGAAVGGVAGKMMFEAVKASVGNENFVGMVQAIVLIGVTGITFVYTIFKKKIHTLTLNNAVVCVIVGLVLGIMSSFLGIGGGPINLMVLGFLFFDVHQRVSTGFPVHYCLFTGYQSGSDRRYGNDSAGAAVLSCIDGHRWSSGRYDRQQDQQEDRG